jgi:hypothetical protein
MLSWRKLSGDFLRGVFGSFAKSLANPDKMKKNMEKKMKTGKVI